MADRSIVVRLRADTSDYTRKMKDAGKATEDAAAGSGSWVEKNSSSLGKLSTQAAIAGAGLIGFAGLAVKTFADFDQAMSNVAATGDDAKGSIDALRQAAIDAGADTVYSASEAAAGIEELAKAGVSATDVLGGGLSGALNLAAAGGIEVADAAETAATTMTQFSLSGADVTHVADLLAASAGKAQGGVSDMSQALKQSGLVAAQFGLSVDETVGTLAAFASKGLLGSDAGTSFRTMLLRLANPSKEAAQRMKDLNVTAYDGQGAFVGMTSLAGQLKTALDPLPQAERDSALAIIFGNDAIRGANVLLGEGADGISNWIDAVDDQGYAAEVAATRLDNLNGDLEQLKGSFETALIGAGSGANDALRGIAQGATEAVNAFSDLPDSAQQATIALVGGAGIVTLGTAGLTKLVTGGIEVINTLKAIGVTGKTAALGISGIGAALAIATIAFTVWAQAQAEARAQTDEYMNTLDEFGNRTDSTLTKIDDALSKDRTGFWENLFGQGSRSIIDEADKFGVTIEEMQGYILGEGDAIDKVNAKMREYLDLHQPTEGHGAEITTENFTAALDGQSNALTDAEKAAGQKAEADRAAAKDADGLKGATEGVTGAVQDETANLEELIKVQSEASGKVLSERDAAREAEQAYDDATEAIKKSTDAHIKQKDMLDITTQAGRDNQAALDGIADAAWRQVDSQNAAHASETDMQTAMAVSRDRYIETAKAMGMGQTEAEKLADKLGLIPTSIKPEVVVHTSGITESQEAINKFIEKNRLHTLFVNVVMKNPPAVPKPGAGKGYGVLAPGGTSENGNLYSFADGGGFDANGNPVARVPQIRPGGGNVLWAEPSTGWEAYISGKPGAHARNVSVLAQAATRLGYAVTKMEAGGAYGYGAAATQAPVTIGMPDGMRLTGQLDLGNGLTGYVDARVSAGLAADKRAVISTRSTKGASW